MTIQTTSVQVYDGDGVKPTKIIDPVPATCKVWLVVAGHGTQTAIISATDRQRLMDCFECRDQGSDTHEGIDHIDMDFVSMREEVQQRIDGEDHDIPIVSLSANLKRAHNCWVKGSGLDKLTVHAARITDL